MNLNKKFADTAFVLAGGKSCRIPFDKQTITIDGQLIATYIADKLSIEFKNVFIVSNTASLYKKYSYPVIPDEVHDCGPLGGLYACLCHTKCEYAYITGCDMPFVNLRYIRYLKKQLNAAEAPKDSIVTASGGLLEPLNAFYNKRLQHVIPKILERGRRHLNQVLRKNAIYVSKRTAMKLDPEGLMFFNLNTMEDYHKYLALKNR